MTKRIIMLLLCAAMTLAPLCASQAEAYTVPGLYTVEYEDGAVIDDTSYLHDKTDTYTWLFMICGSDYAIDASMTKMDFYEGMSLYSATEDERTAYLEDTKLMLEEFNGEYLGIVDKIGIPFYVFSCENDDGAYLWAETVANGYTLDFYCYYDDDRMPVDEALLEKFSAMLESFEPVQ